MTFLVLQITVEPQQTTITQEKDKCWQERQSMYRTLFSQSCDSTQLRSQAGYNAVSTLQLQVSPCPAKACLFDCKAALLHWEVVQQLK